MHIHKWNYYGKQFRKGQQNRTCDKCFKQETLHHLLHQGISVYFYDEIKQKPFYEEIKRKEKNNMYLLSFYFFGLLPFIFLTVFTKPKPLEFYVQIGDYAIPFGMFLMFFLLICGIILYNVHWKIWKLYSIPVDSEEVIDNLYPTVAERLRESQIKAEKILMYRFSTGEISEEEYTAKMARL